jgi:hypothetical protein
MAGSWIFMNARRCTLHTIEMFPRKSEFKVWDLGIRSDGCEERMKLWFVLCVFGEKGSDASFNEIHDENSFGVPILQSPRNCFVSCIQYNIISLA